MNLRKLKVISAIAVFLVGFLIHSVYENFPNVLTSFLFPVNESIWEHMKMIYLSYIIISIFELIIIKKYKLNKNNFGASLVLSIIFNIAIFLLLYIPIYLLISYNTVVTLIIYFISICITEYISYKILTSKQTFTFLNKSVYLLLILMLLIFIYLTYYPIKNEIFFDKQNNKLGIYNSY